MLVNGPISIAVCAEVAQLQAEVARANKIAALTYHQTEAAKVLAAIRATKTPNSDAVALAHLAGQLGYHPSVDQVSLGLSILTVLLVEVGGGLLLALGASVNTLPATKRTPEPVQTDAITMPVVGAQAAPKAQAAPVSAVDVPKPARKPAKRRLRMSGDVAKARVAQALKLLPSDASVRTVAKASKVPKSTVHEIMAGLSVMAATGAAVNQFGGVTS